MIAQLNRFAQKVIFVSLIICGVFTASGQMTNHQKMIELGKNYKDFMFRNEPSKDVLKDLKSDIPENLNVATEFILQTIKTKNKLLTQPYLSRPEDKILK